MKTFRDLYLVMKDRPWKKFILCMKGKKIYDEFWRIYSEPMDDSPELLKVTIEQEDNHDMIQVDDQDTLHNFEYRKTRNSYKKIFEIIFNNKFDSVITIFHGKDIIQDFSNMECNLSTIYCPISYVYDTLQRLFNNFELEEIKLRSDRIIIYRNMDIMVVPMVKFFNDNGLPTVSSCQGHSKENLTRMFYITFDDVVKEQEILAFQNNHRDAPGNFFSYGYFSNVLNIVHGLPYERWKYIAVNHDEAMKDLDMWIKDNE